MVAVHGRQITSRPKESTCLRPVLATDVLLFRHWRDHAARKGKSKYPILISSKHKFFNLQIYVMLNIIFVCEIFSFDTALYFLRNIN
jgi:hypothetical protein